ncbi:MAG: pantoate--beta-alanine ligase [Gemmatimonadota bacterium]
MTTVDRIAALRQAVSGVRADRRRIGLVPTMGALHEGHLSLCDIARKHCDFVVLSIFVNPLQFGADEDLDRYPRSLAADSELARGRGVDLIFAPPTEEIYPRGPSLVRVSAPGLDDRLCGHFRPGHFTGVLTIVAKLFNLVAPDVAVFGRKDLQQVALIRWMVHDLDFAVDIVAAPVVREPDGLALSSRNAYIDTAARGAAASLSQALRAAQQAFDAGERDPAALVGAAHAILERAPGVEVQYVELVDADTLDTPGRAERGHALALAAFAGGTRLIDNHLLE